MTLRTKASALTDLFLYAAKESSELDNDRILEAKVRTVIRAANSILKGHSVRAETLFDELHKHMKAPAQPARRRIGDAPPRRGSRRWRYLIEARYLGKKAAQHERDKEHVVSWGNSNWTTTAVETRMTEWADWAQMHFNDTGRGKEITLEEEEEAQRAMWEAYKEERKAMGKPVTGDE